MLSPSNPSRTSSVNVRRLANPSSASSKSGYSGPSSPVLMRGTSASSAPSKPSSTSTGTRLVTAASTPMASSRSTPGIGPSIKKGAQPVLVPSAKLDLTGKPIPPVHVSRNHNRILSGSASHSTSPSLFEEDPLDEVDDQGVDDFDMTPIKKPVQGQSAALQVLEPIVSPTFQSTAHPQTSGVIEDHFSLNSGRPSNNSRTPVKPLPDSTTSGSPYPNTVATRTYEELLTKYKLMEARRNEDRDKLRELEKVKEETENWNNTAKPKLQAKLNECAEEIKALKKLVCPNSKARACHPFPNHTPIV